MDKNYRELYYRYKSQLDGKQAKRRILLGRPVRYKDIQRQLLVKRGKLKKLVLLHLVL